METTGTFRRRMLLPVLVFVWALAIVGGAALVWDFETTPGAPATPPDVWPIASRLPHSANHPTLVMMVHPHCPCSRASLEELDRLMAHVGDRVTAHVLFANPEGVSQGRTHTRLWHRAAEIRGVEVSGDDGTEAMRFHRASARCATSPCSKPSSRAPMRTRSVSSPRLRPSSGRAGSASGR